MYYFELKTIENHQKQKKTPPPPPPIKEPGIPFVGEIYIYAEQFISEDVLPDREEKGSSLVKGEDYD